MNFDNLKQLLIERALRGKLVPQIETELAVKQIGIQPDNVPFNVPEKWKWIYLENGVVEKIKYGYTASAAASGNARLLRISDIQAGKVLWETMPYCSIEKDKIASYEVKIGDIVVARTGGTIGKSFLINEEPEKTVFASYLLRIRLGKGISAQYLYLFMQSRLYWAQLVKRSRGTGQPNVNATSLGKLLIPIPPLEEQHRIVARLEKLLSALTKAEQAYQEITGLTEQLRKQILQQAICGQLIPQNSDDEPTDELIKHIYEKSNSLIYRGEDNLLYEKTGKKIVCIEELAPFEIPSSWGLARLGNLCNPYTGNSINKTEKKLKYTNIGNGRYYIGTKDVSFNHQINYDNGVRIPETSTEFRVAPKNSILLCIEGGSAGRKIALTNRDVCFGNKLCCFNSSLIDNKFLYYYLQSPSFKSVFNNKKSGLIGGVTKNNLKLLIVPVPPLEEQIRIVAKVDKLFQQLDNLTL